MVLPKVPTPKYKAPPHLQWLKDTGKPVKTADGRIVKVMEFHHKNDDSVLSAWAKHFRNQYCRDEQIDALRKGTPHSRAEYLRNLRFPDAARPPGPSIRSGDFAEVLVSDYLEFTMQFWLPRTRYDRKAVRNESTKGTDIIGFRFADEGKVDPKDTLALFETKADLTGKTPSKRLQDAVDDSAKDEMRKAESLNAIKQRLLDDGKAAHADKVERFQNPEDRPYTEQYGAVALLSTPIFDLSAIKTTTASAHPKDRDLTLIVIHGKEMMALVHTLYEKAANEA